MTTGKPLTHEDLTAQIAADKKARLERIAAAKAAAPAGKEPIDLELIKRSARTSALGTANDDDLRVRLEVIYYLDSPKLMTNAQLIAYVEELSRWS